MGEVAAASPWVLLYSYLLTFQYHPEKYERVRDNARKSLHLSEILNIDAVNRLIHYYNRKEPADHTNDGKYDGVKCCIGRRF